jgi:hypothetical protein
MSIFRSDALELSFLDEIFTDDFPELPSILMQSDDHYMSLCEDDEEPVEYVHYFDRKPAEDKKAKRKSRWSEGEDSVIVDLVEKYGHSWKYFTKFLPGRPADSIKSRYYSYLKKKHAVEPSKILTLSKPSLPSEALCFRLVEEEREKKPRCCLHMTDDSVVESLLKSEVYETSSTSSRSTSDLTSQQDSKQALLKRLYAEMSGLEKVLARTYLEIDRLQSAKQTHN